MTRNDAMALWGRLCGIMLLTVPVTGSSVSGVAAAASPSPAVGCEVGHCDGGKGECVKEPIALCDGLDGFKCVFNTELTPE